MSKALGQHCKGRDAVPFLSCNSQARPSGGLQFRSERDECHNRGAMLSIFRVWVNVTVAMPCAGRKPLQTTKTRILFLGEWKLTT